MLIRLPTSMVVRVGLEPTAFTTWVADLQSAAFTIRHT